MMKGSGRRRLLTVTLSAVLVAGAVAGCGSTPAAPAADQILDVFAGAQRAFTPNFNPFSQTKLPGTDSMIYEALFYFNGAKSGDVQPQLGTKYEFADAGKTINFTIREGVKWSDGQPLTTEDVAYTFNLIKDHPTANLNGLPLDAATVTDATHVSVKFTEAAYTKLPAAAGRVYIVPKHLWTSVPDPEKYTNDKPVGSGPFKLTSFAAQNYVVERNTDYWESGKPKIKGMRFLSFNGNDSATAALGAGQVDWAGSFIADIDQQFISKDREHNHFLNESFIYITNLVPNLAKAPFNDPAVRKAISLALDRDRIIKLAFAGLGKPASPAELPRPVFDDFIKSDYKNLTLDHKPEVATQTLEQAGYTKGGDGIYAKGGQRLSFGVKVVAGYSDYISALQIITENLKAVGIDLRTDQVSFAAFSTAQQTGDFDMIITNAFGDSVTAYAFYYNLFGTKQTAPIGQVANANYSRFSDADVDRALETIAATPPDQTDTIKAQTGKIQDIIVPRLPYVPLQQSSALAEFRTTKATGWPSEDNHYAVALPFNGPDIGIVAKNLVPVG